MAVGDDISPLDAERVYAGFHRRLRSFVARLVRNPTDRDDVLQDIYLRVHRRIGGLRSQERIAPWLFQVARSAVTDHHRRSHSRQTGMTDSSVEESVAAPEADSFAGVNGSAAMAACVVPMLATLPAADQEAARMTDVDGLTQRDAARQAGVTLTAMKSRVQRSRAKLRRMLADCCHLELDRRGRVIGHEPRVTGCAACGAGDSAPARFSSRKPWE